MSYLEGSGFLTFDEYRQHEPSRVLADELQVDDVYNLMMLLAGGEHNVGVTPLRVMGLSEVKLGTAAVRLAFLDQDFNTVIEANEVMRDGYFGPVKRVCFVDGVANTRYDIARAYLRNYYDDAFGGLAEAASSIRVPHFV
jgi:hypothetical protein